MRIFSECVDLRSRKEMTAYLQNHFRYDTMNSWNWATSYACNLKIHKLGLSWDKKPSKKRPPQSGSSSNFDLTG